MSGIAQQFSLPASAAGGVFLAMNLMIVGGTADINIRKPVEEMVIDEWMTMMAVNTKAIFLGCKYLIPVFRKQGKGLFINTSSVCGLIGHKYTPEAYTATKGAVTCY